MDIYRHSANDTRTQNRIGSHTYAHTHAQREREKVRNNNKSRRKSWDTGHYFPLILLQKYN